MIRKLLKRTLLAIIVAALGTQPVLAQTSALLDFNSNDIYNYRPVPLGTGSCGGATGMQELEGHKLPAAKGGTGLEEEINNRGQVKQHWGKPDVGFLSFAENIQNASTDPIPTIPGAPSMQQLYMDYYITMRWRYVTWNWNGNDGGSGPEDKQFYEGGDGSPAERAANAPRVLVRNPKTNKSIIAVVLEAGPAPWTGVDTGPNNNPKQGWTNPQDGTPDTYRGRVAGFPPKAFEALGATQRMYNAPNDDNDLEYSWAPKNAIPGPLPDSKGTGYQDNSTCSGGIVTIDGLNYAWPVAPQTSRSYGSTPCNDPSGCHHDGTAAFDLLYGKDGSLDGAAVYAITDGRVFAVQTPYVLPEARDAVRNGDLEAAPGCQSLHFRADIKYSLNEAHNAKYGGSTSSGQKDFWYGHIKNVSKFPDDGDITAGTKIAEVADMSFGWQCRGGRDHLHIDQGCLDGGEWDTGGRKSCRHTGFVKLMNDIHALLPKPSGEGD